MKLCYRCLKESEPKEKWDGKAKMYRLGCQHCGSFVFFS